MADRRGAITCWSATRAVYEGMVHLDVEWSELTESLGAPMATFAARI